MAFLDSLVDKGILTRPEYEEVLRDLDLPDADVDDLLKEKGIPHEKLLALRGEYFKIPTKNIEGLTVPSSVLENVPEESALYYKFVPLGITEGVLEVGIVDPDNVSARDAVQFIAGKLNLPYKIYLISSPGFKGIINQYHGLTGQVSQALSDFGTTGDEQFLDDVETLAGVSLTELSEKEVMTEGNLSEQAPVIKMVNVILRHAIEARASDIHVEPTDRETKVRIRVDGTMQIALTLPRNVHQGIVARVKILCAMRLDEKRKPQDGRFSARINGRKIDFRVSTFPTYSGEKVVMRILDPEAGVSSLEQLGFTGEQALLLREIVKAPYGMILLTGPTGSGKTTTLYAMLAEMEKGARNVVSLEDPIEYHIEGVSQSQVRPEIDYTFASGLRSILRQDPDVILVGEIRDKETAQLAIQAALTGHLVLSTIHTNTATGVVPRLVDMGVDPFLISPTLIAAIGQRLARRTCMESVEMEQIDEPTRMLIDKQVRDLSPEAQRAFIAAKQITRAKKTEGCPQGTKGRIAVTEILKFDKDFANLVLKSPTEPDMYALARKKGMTTLREDAMLKSFAGLIPWGEVLDL